MYTGMIINLNTIYVLLHKTMFYLVTLSKSLIYNSNFISILTDVNQGTITMETNNRNAINIHIDDND